MFKVIPNSVITYTGANGVKAYLCHKGEKSENQFTFVKSEAFIFDYQSVVDHAMDCATKEESFFIHDHNAATLPAGLTWNVETIN